MIREKLNWRQLASMKAGGAICLPVIMVGQSLCNTYGLGSALTKMEKRYETCKN